MKRNKAKKHQSFALKLDMMKAYDRVEWPYLRAIMVKLGFTERWVDIVMGLVTTVKFSVIFNGKRLEEFDPSRGIRQGDPISPYMFLLAAEGLSCLLNQKVSHPIWLVYKWLLRRRQLAIYYSLMTACCSVRQIVWELMR